MDFGVNQGLVEEKYLRFRENPHAVEPAWRAFFERLSAPERAEMLRGNGASPPEPTAPARHDGNGHDYGGNGAQTLADAFPEHRSRSSLPPLAAEATPHQLQERVTAMVNAYRERGHLVANIDPLGLRPQDTQGLSLEHFELQDVDPELLFATGNFAGPDYLPLREFIARLKETYCRHIGVEFRHIEVPEARSWLQNSMESSRNHIDLDHDDQVRILSKLIDAEMFEQFLHTKYVGAKRFSLEGAESLIPMSDLVIETAGQLGVEEIVIGMAHRGRLNVLANVMEKNLKEIFAAFEDDNPELSLGRGDVKYHLGYSSDRITKSGQPMHLTLAFNPSHLEFVNPVVEGRVRAKQDRRGDRERKKVLPFVIHGDAAFIGQGIVQETINLSGLRGYTTGGTIHVVLNNQIGYTTVTEDARSTRYCTDVTRMLRCPVFHVNGEDPEAIAQVVNLAVHYRQRFHSDVVIDMYCYRRYGHNEADEPRFTQPRMYDAIDEKPTVRDVYIRHLIERGTLKPEETEHIEQARRQLLEDALDATREYRYVPPINAMQGLWTGFRGGADAECPEADTSVPLERLLELARRSNQLPEGFKLHPKLRRVLERREDPERPVDWGTAEMLAYASLVTTGNPVRLSGQDSRRGTFSHRHAVLYDIETGQHHTPLAYMQPDQARFEAWDSPLSEAGVLGFEFGFSLDYPDALTLWEAQFGDFCNGGQVIIDQFISSSEDKWYRLSGLVCLLPHGFEGQGPEHSSARLERWLALCAEDNLQICYPTLPAQFFHLLRRQVVRPYRKPLIVMTPKSLLRHPDAVSPWGALANGKFERIIPDQAQLDPQQVKRVILCSGKIYHELAAARAHKGIKDIAIIRLEQLYPLRADQVVQTLAPYKNGTPLVWVQEEPWNMGAWFYIRARLPEMLGERLPLSCISRPENASPATGSTAAHKIEQNRLIEAAIPSPQRGRRKRTKVA